MSGGGGGGPGHYYESYINNGHHASEGGTINIHHQTTNYQFSLSNSLEEPQNRRAALDSGVSKQPKRRLNSGPSADLSRSKRQRIGDFVQITLDVAKQSTDFGNPLKAALAGVGALVEHFQEFKGVKDEVEGLLPQLNMLGQNDTTATDNGDPEETRRHVELISTLRDIEKRSHQLLERGRFGDKGTDFTEVAVLVKQFREAIAHYQTSQQRATYNQIIDLVSSFNTLLRLEEKSLAVKIKLHSVTARLDRLCSTEDNYSDNGPGYGLWAKLFNSLSLIRDNGNTLYDRIRAQSYNETEDDIQVVSQITEDIRDCLLDYQIAKQSIIYDENCKSIDAADLAVLNHCRRARGAEYRHGNRRGCLRGTREVLLNDIESWTKDFDKSPVFWLNGLAGTGKSTIAQTIAERAFADGLLGASFFCSRDFEDRSDLHFIFPTLAFQLAHKFPCLLTPLVSLLQTNPDVVDESLYNQMEKLIVEPLRSAEIWTVIVIDALDECKDDEPSSAILSVLGRLVEQIPRVKFFITGRPEPRIQTGFRLPLLEDATKIFVLHDVHPDSINSDILVFLKHELSELSRRHRLEGWPSDENINLLCQRAAGLFVYAVATVKFLDSRTHLPDRRLDVIVNLPQCTVPEGKTQVRPRTTLDSLYMSVLQMAFSEEDPEVDSKVRSIIGAVVLLVNPLPPSGIAELTNLDPREVILLLTSVQSLLILGEDPTQPVKSFHKSFPDFVIDPSRCNDTRFYITPENSHLKLAINCLIVLNNGLEQNLLNLPDYALNSEVKDLQKRVDDRTSVGLRYACLSWHNHLTRCQGDVTDAILRLRFFLEKKFLAWLEVLSALKAARAAVVGLEKLMVWLQEISRDNQLLDTARDCFYFVTGFFEPINLSAPHIWHSALELSPLSSIIRKLYYHQRFNLFPTVETGIPDSWEPSTTILSDPRDPITWSPCGQFVAIRGTDTVKIQDALTLELVSTLQPVTRKSYSDPHSYSQDGHFLACITPTDIRIWDIQTGGVAKRIQVNLEHHDDTRLVWSSDGTLLGVLSCGAVNIYDVASGRILSSTRVSDARYLWAHTTSFRVMTRAQDRKTTLIDIFEVGPALVKIETFSVQLAGKYVTNSFSPTTYHISAFGDNSHLVFDIRNSARLLLENGYYAKSTNTFSSDGAFFAAAGALNIHIWNYDAGEYIPWRQFPHLYRKSVPTDIQFSPTSSSILVRTPETVRIWHLDHSPLFNGSPIHKRLGHLDIFSRSGTRIATAHGHEKTITITNLISQTDSQSIDTGIPVVGLGLTGNVLLVKDFSVVRAWLLTVTEEGRVSIVLGNGRAGPSDSIWTISLPQRVHPKFSVEGDTGVIKYGKTLHVYNSGTGEVLDSAQRLPRFSGSWYSFDDYLEARDHHRSGSMPNALSKFNWKRSDTTWNWKDGWLKDLQGKCLLWLPPEWRMEWRGNVEWFPDISTLKLKSLQDRKPIMIKLH